MQTEFEAKFLNIDVPALRARLAELGAKLVRPETLMRRTVFHPPVAMPGAWLRVRDEGDRITMSLKQVTGRRIEDQREAELVIRDYDAGCEFLASLGARRKAYQETRRESYSLDGASIDIDTWPGLPTYVEIEAESEAAVRAMAARLGYDYSQAVFGASAVVYERILGIPRHILNDHTPSITFADPPTAFSGIPERPRRLVTYPRLLAAYAVLSAAVLAFVQKSSPLSDSRPVFAALLGPTAGLSYDGSLLAPIEYAAFTAVFLSFLLVPFELRGRAAKIAVSVLLAIAWLFAGFFIDGSAYYT